MNRILFGASVIGAIGAGITLYMTNNEAQPDQIKRDKNVVKKMALQCLGGHTLKNLKADLQPEVFENKNVNVECNKLFTIIKEVLKPHQIVKSGSFGRGTNIKAKFDVDVVVVMSCTNFMHTLIQLNKHKSRVGENQLEVQHPQITQWRGLLSNKLRQVYQVKINDWDTHMINFKTDHDGVEFDIMIVPHLMPTQIKNTITDFRLTGKNEINRMLSAALKPSELKPYKSAPPNAKTMIRVVKYWSKIHDWKVDNQRNAYPISFGLETIMLTIWNDNPSETDFKLLIKFFEAILDCCDGRRTFLDLGTGLPVAPLRNMACCDRLAVYAHEALEEIQEMYRINL
jgi:hypothetical protein